MLPSFRLVVAAFLCGFVAVSAALHLFASARLAHESSPLATGVAALPVGGGNAHDWRRDAAAAPVMFEPRFAIDAATTAPAPAGLTLHAIHRATGALPKAEPEMVALLPDRDSPASVMLPVPIAPAPAVAARAPEHAGAGQWIAAIGLDPIEHNFREPPIVVPASKATADIPARDVEQTIKTPVASTPAGQEVVKGPIVQGIDVKQHVVGPALVPSTVAQENPVRPPRVDPAIEQQSHLQSEVQASAAKQASVGPADDVDAAVRPSSIGPATPQDVGIDPVVVEQESAPMAAAEHELAELRANESVVDRQERTVPQTTLGVAAKQQTNTPAAFEDVSVKKVAREQPTTREVAVRQESDTPSAIDNAAPEQETLEQPGMQEAAVEHERNPPAAMSNTAFTQQAAGQTVVADVPASNETVAEPAVQQSKADQVVEQQAPQRVASITPDVPPPVAQEPSAVATAAPSAPIAPVAALAPHAPLGEDLPATADDATTPETADQPIEPVGPDQRPATPAEPEADASSEFTAMLITPPKLPKARPPVRTVRATPAVRAKPTHRAKPAIQVRRKVATKRIRPIRQYRREATTDPFGSPFQSNWPQ